MEPLQPWSRQTSAPPKMLLMGTPASSGKLINPNLDHLKPLKAPNRKRPPKSILDLVRKYRKTSFVCINLLKKQKDCNTALLTSCCRGPLTAVPDSRGSYTPLWCFQWLQSSHDFKFSTKEIIVGLILNPACLCA